MSDEQRVQRRHESVDHERPTDAGLMNDGDGEVPGTGIMGDETLVESTGAGQPGIVPGPVGGTGAEPDAGPTPEKALERAEKQS
ncbi:MAG: hypothetical protein ACR2LS_05825 [Thermomicrobiales bacterium]